MSDNEIQKIQNNVSASLAIECAYASEEAKEINRRFLQGELTSEEAIEMIRGLYVNAFNDKLYDKELNKNIRNMMRKSTR